MFMATGQPAALIQNERPPWVTEWMDAHSARKEKEVARINEPSAKPVDEKTAALRRAKHDNRVEEGIELLGKVLLDMVREGLASSTSRSEDLGKPRQTHGRFPGPRIGGKPPLHGGHHAAGFGTGIRIFRLKSAVFISCST